jgi:hypothetical protein
MQGLRRLNVPYSEQLLDVGVEILWRREGLIPACQSPFLHTNTAAGAIFLGLAIVADLAAALIGAGLG